MKKRVFLWVIAAIAIMLAVLLVVAAVIVGPLLRLIPGVGEALPYTATSEFLPMPHRVAVSYGNRQGVLSIGQVAELHTALTQAMKQATDVKLSRSRIGFLEEGLPTLQFEYLNSYRYTSGYLTSGTFDKARVLIEENGIYVTLFSSPLGEADVISVTLPEEGADFAVRAKQLIAACIGNPTGVPTHTVNADAVETATFAARPDAVLVKGEGGTLQLSEAQAEEIYDAFERMNAARDGYIRGPADVCKCYYTLEEVYADIDAECFVEFRYDRRQHFSGTLYQYDPDPEWGPEETVYVEEDLTYDSVLLLLSGRTTRIIGSVDGLYFCLTGRAPNGGFDFGPDFQAFCEEAKALTSAKEVAP